MLSLARGVAHPSLGVYRLIWRVGRALPCIAEGAGSEVGRPAGPGVFSTSAGWYHRQTDHPMGPSRGALPAPGNGQCTSEAGGCRRSSEDPKVQSCSGCCGADALCARALLASRTHTGSRAGAMGPTHSRTHSLARARDRTNGRGNRMDGWTAGRDACVHAIAGNTVISLYKYGYGMCAVAGAVCD